MNKVLEALQFRHACKVFDPKKKLSDDILAEILDCGRLSPSSFGMEPWKFVVVQSDDLRKQLREACWGQPQITDGSAAVVILTNPERYKSGSEYVKDKFKRRGLPEEALKGYLDKYTSHQQTEIDPYMNLYAWASKQCYIALGNMLTAAAAQEVDSCPIEGFSKSGVEKVLDIADSPWQAVVVFTLGYRKDKQSPRLRDSFKQIIEYR